MDHANAMTGTRVYPARNTSVNSTVGIEAPAKTRSAHASRGTWETSVKRVSVWKTVTTTETVWTESVSVSPVSRVIRASTSTVPSSVVLRESVQSKPETNLYVAANLGGEVKTVLRK